MRCEESRCEQKPVVSEESCGVIDDGPGLVRVAGFLNEQKRCDERERRGEKDGEGSMIQVWVSLVESVTARRKCNGPWKGVTARGKGFYLTKARAQGQVP